MEMKMKMKMKMKIQFKNGNKKSIWKLEENSMEIMKNWGLADKMKKKAVCKTARRAHGQ